MRGGIVLLCVVGAVGCGGADVLEPQCLPEMRANFLVEARDSVTGWAMAGEVAGTAVDAVGTIVLEALDTLRLSDKTPADRPGTFVVTLTANGYAPWQRTVVVERENACHVATARIDARLQPAAAPAQLQPLVSTVVNDDAYTGTARAVVERTGSGLAVSGWLLRTNTCHSLAVVASQHGRQVDVNLMQAPKGFNCEPVQQWFRFHLVFPDDDGRYRVLVRDAMTAGRLADTVIG